MNLTLTVIDYAALSPLLILLVGALAILLVESFNVEAKKLTFAITVVTLVIAFYAALMSPVSTNPLLTPWLKFDALARVFTLFFLSIGLACTLLGASFLNRFGNTHGEYYFLLLTAVMGLILIGASADFLTLFLGIETLSISLYVWCGYMKEWKISQESSMKYFLMGALAAAFLLYGIALMYGAVGSTQLDAMLPGYRSLANPSGQILFLSGVALVTLALAFEAAIVPFHVWAPDVYDGAPTPVTAFMSVGTKVGAFAAFARVFMVSLTQFNPLWNELIAWLAYPTLIYANFVAIRQIQLRRFFAYSGISHAGFLLIPVAAGTPDALPALLFYLIVYAFATLGAFAVFAQLDYRSEGVLLTDLYGLFKRSPWLAGLLSLCLLTLAGIPPTVGFFTKFFVFKVAFQAGYYALVVVGLLTTILSAYYYLRIVAVMMTKVPEETTLLSWTWPAAIVGAFSFFVILVFSFNPAPIMGILK